MKAEQIVLIAVAVAGLLAAQAVFYFVVYLGQQRRSELRRRLHALARPGDAGPVLIRERRLARSPGMARLLGALPSARTMEGLLLQTDLSWTVATVLALGVAFAATFFVGAIFVLDQPFTLSLLGVPLGMVVPLFFVLDARSRRSKRLSQQLPDALDMMTRSLRAGHGIGGALELVAAEMPPPIAVEFGRLYEEQKYGIPLRDSVVSMTERVPGNLDLRIFSVSLLLQAEVGGNLVEILEHNAHTIRERYKFFGKLAALTAEGKASGVVLALLPFVCVAAVLVVNPSYLAPLVTDPLGRMIALGGVAIWTTGVLWIRRMVGVSY